MRFHVRHETAYGYDAPVTLGPHVLRLTPRPRGIRLHSHTLAIAPETAQRRDETDTEGNSVTHVSFSGTTRRFRILSDFELETLPPPPLEGSREPLPWKAMNSGLSPSHVTWSAHADIHAFADGLADETQHRPLAFLDRLCREVSTRIALGIRPIGDARPAHETLALGRGACRDMAVLFLDACRAQGIPAASSAATRRTPTMPTGAATCMPGRRYSCQVRAGAAGM